MREHCRRLESFQFFRLVSFVVANFGSGYQVLDLGLTCCDLEIQGSVTFDIGFLSLIRLFYLFCYCSFFFSLLGWRREDSHKDC